MRTGPAAVTVPLLFVTLVTLISPAPARAQGGGVIVAGTIGTPETDLTPDQQQHGASYNFAPTDHPMPDREGLSVFSIDDDGAVYHTYSTYARGIDTLNVAYQLLDLTSKGRDEQELAMPQAWVRRHDEYE